ncbi:MAG: DNA-binding HxlR family transcriptional regulator [Candidatus Latescibacterota bacterium]|jgi:DNA-binding HxlR family transcriptional regulator
MKQALFFIKEQGLFVLGSGIYCALDIVGERWTLLVMWKRLEDVGVFLGGKL